MEQHFGKNMQSQYSQQKNIPIQTHDHIYIFLKHMGPYVGIRPKIFIMIPNTFWSNFFSEHACSKLEIVFLSFIYLVPNRHQHNEIQLCYLKTYWRTENAKRCHRHQTYLDELRYGSCTKILRQAFNDSLV